MKEIITFGVGGTGFNINCACWELFCLEHGIDITNGLEKESSLSNRNILFKEREFEGKTNYIPRTFFIDTDNEYSHNLNRLSMKNLVSPNNYICGKESSGGIYYEPTSSNSFTELSERLNFNLRKEIECCDSLDSIFMFHSVSGGTGSGLTNTIINLIKENYHSKVRINHFTVYPSKNCSYNENYNCILSTDYLNLSNLCFLFNNEELLKSKQDFKEINNYIAKIVSIFTSFRLNNLDIDMDTLSKHLNVYDLQFISTSIENSLERIFESSNSIKYLSNALILKGINLKRLDVLKSVSSIQKTLNYKSTKGIKTIISKDNDESVTLFSNNSNSKFLFKDQLKIFSKIFSKRYGLHWYSNINNDDFKISKEKISKIISNYE